MRAVDASVRDLGYATHPKGCGDVRGSVTTREYNPRCEARLMRAQGQPGTDRPDAVVVAGSLLELVRMAAADPQPWRFSIALPAQPSLDACQIADLARKWGLSGPR
jgi:hypothetical protein